MKSKYVYLLLISALGSMASCSKSTPPITPEKPIVTVPIPPPPTTTPPATDPPGTTPPVVIPPTSTAKLLPIKIEAPGLSFTLKYLGNTNDLSSIDYGSGKLVVITYQNNQMTGLQTLQGKNLLYIDYSRDSKNRIIEGRQWSTTEDMETPVGYYKIEYNEQQQISKVNYYSAKNVLLRTKTFAYELSNDKMGIIIESDEKETTTYTFDLQNGLFKNVANAQLIAMETGDNFFLSAQHNLLSIKSTNPKNDLTCTYEYNTDAYPTLITWQALNVKMTFKVSYKTL